MSQVDTNHVLHLCLAPSSQHAGEAGCVTSEGLEHLQQQLRLSSLEDRCWRGGTSNVSEPLYPEFDKQPQLRDGAQGKGLWRKEALEPLSRTERSPASHMGTGTLFHLSSTSLKSHHHIKGPRLIEQKLTVHIFTDLQLDPEAPTHCYRTTRDKGSFHWAPHCSSASPYTWLISTVAITSQSSKIFF